MLASLGLQQAHLVSCHHVFSSSEVVASFCWFLVNHKGALGWAWLAIMHTYTTHKTAFKRR